jgi:hypothetical protein
MGKKKPAAKTAPPAPALAKEDLAIQVLCAQQHLPSARALLGYRGTRLRASVRVSEGYDREDPGERESLDL